MTKRDRRIVVTGGAGFIGSHVVQELLDAGATVHVIDNVGTGRKSHVPDEASLDVVDIRDATALREAVVAFEPTDIVHLAAIHFVPYCNDHPEETFDVNVMGTRNLLAAARDLDTLERLVYASSAAVYPPRETANSEASLTGPTDIYGRTKLIGEDLVELFHTETGIETRSARLFNVYGPNETNPHLIPAVVEQVAVDGGEIELGNLSPRRDFVHVTDVARALTSMLGFASYRSTTAQPGIDTVDPGEGHRTYNVGTGRSYSVREVAELVIEAAGGDRTITQTPGRVRKSDRPDLKADIERIRSELWWEPTVRFADGIAELVTRWKDEPIVPIVVAETESEHDGQ